MIVKNGKTYDDNDLRLYGKGYWDGRFCGYNDSPIKDTNTYAYTLGFQHGEADYLANDADFSPDPVFDDLDVVEQIKNHPL
jgi:hypothetical protein